jgi:uncharacterized protein (DUF2384 family)
MTAIPSQKPGASVARNGMRAFQPVSKSVRRRLEAAGKAKIRHYRRCFTMLHRIDCDVLKAGLSLLKNERGLVAWLSEPSPALDGKIPLDVMRTIKGRKDVADILRGLGHGNFL